MTQAIYVRIDEELLRKFDEVARRMGYMRSEAVREAMRKFIFTKEEASETKRIRGTVKTKLTLKELEEAYMVMK